MGADGTARGDLGLHIPALGTAYRRAPWFPGETAEDAT